MAARQDSLRLRAKESTAADFEAFDPGRGDCLGAQQESSYRLRVDETSSLQVETDDAASASAMSAAVSPARVIGLPTRGSGTYASYVQP